MKRMWFLAPATAGAALIGALLLYPAFATADRKAEAKETNKSSTADLLPVSQVVLFSSGVGYFQREGTVEGTQRVDLSFPTQDINDLIKSLTLRDLDDGHINAVTYDGNVPVERTLQSFAINLASNPSLGQILDQARGEKVEAVLQQGAAQPGTVTGSIIGIERKRVQVGKEVVAVECLNLWCTDGMRSLKLTEVQRVRFLNAVMDREFKKALETLALGHDTQKRTVSIHFTGKGKRRVKVGYVVENPVWKTSYRLVLNKQEKGAKDQAQPYLQGWAVVENTTDEDWNGVKMALISGRPISFRMNLYDALFIKRPLVEPELFASLRPPTYSGGLGGQEGLAMSRGGAPLATGAVPTSKSPPRAGWGGKSDGKDKAYDANFAYRRALQKQLNERMDLGKSVASAASASKLGDYFQYAIDHAVTLPRQKSALLPIVGKDVAGERLSIYNEGTHAKFPLLGLAFKNTTGMHLTQGPITVYEGSTYAGDARISDLQKGERRLLSYAIDLGTEVHAVPHSDNGRLTSVRIDKGILYTKTRIKDTKTYTIANRNDVNRVVLIEHRNRSDFHLTSKDKPWETARDFYRFKVTVPAGKTLPYTVSEEKDVSAQVTLTNNDSPFIRITINDKATGPKVKEALAKALQLKGKLSETQREIQQQERQLRVITTDQDRLRKNLREMPQGALAYKRYLKKFNDQETRIEKLQDRIEKLQNSEHAQRKQYETFLSNLTVD